VAREIKKKMLSVIEKSYRLIKKSLWRRAYGQLGAGDAVFNNKGFLMAGCTAPYREDEVVEWIMRHRNPDVE